MDNSKAGWSVSLEGAKGQATKQLLPQKAAEIAQKKHIRKPFESLGLTAICGAHLFSDLNHLFVSALHLRLSAVKNALETFSGGYVFLFFQAQSANSAQALTVQALSVRLAMPARTPPGPHSQNSLMPRAAAERMQVSQRTDETT